MVVSFKLDAGDATFPLELALNTVYGFGLVA
jgi:hypothetical protein